MSLRTVRRASPALVALALLGCPPGGGASAPQAAPTEAVQASQAPGTPAAPVAPKPIDRASLKTPWKDAKVGDWCLYKILKPREMEFRFEVSAVGERDVTWVQKDKQGDVRQTEKVDLGEADERYKDPASLDALTGAPEKQTAEVAGKQLEILVVKRTHGGGTTETWLSESLPPFMEGGGGQATVRSIKDGELMIELLDFGRGQ